MKIERVRQFFCVFFILFLSGFSLFAQAPVADFTADRTEGCGVIAVRFTDASTNSPTSYLWEVVNDGRTYNGASPTVTFTMPGQYTIRLTATNASGSGVVEKVGFIKVYANPQVSFLASPRSGCAPLSVNFTDNTVSASPIVTRNWDYGDGNTSAAQNPTHLYLNPANYTVILTVTNEDGCTQSLSQPNYISIDTRPTANFTQNLRESCTAPFEVSFTSTSTGPIESYAWNFGDGNTSTLQNPTHTYTTEGEFTVSLTVTSPAGCSDTRTIDNHILVNAFQPDFTVSQTSVCRGQPVVFTDASNASVSSRTWSFGDATTSNLANPTKVYAAAGVYTVSYSATSSAGCPQSIEYTNIITVHELPVVTVMADDSISCVAPFDVTFSTTTPNITAWNWNFGGGGSSTLENPTHTYNALGNYTVSLTVTDANSCVGTASKPNYIRIREPQADFISDVTGGCFPLDVQFTDASVSDNTIISWEWDFGDGGTSTDQSPSYTFAVDTGRYDITLTITDDRACTNTIVMAEYIGVGMQPIPGFFALETQVCYNTITEFMDTSYVGIDKNPANQWLWDFGDGNTSTEQNPEHLYEDIDTFTVQLTVGHYQCFADTTIVDYIIILPPLAQYTISPPVLCVFPEAVQFIEAAIGADTYTWDFGDGNVMFVEDNGIGGYRWEYNGVEIVADTNTVNPTHVYTIDGTYTTQLMVQNLTTNCADSIQIEFYVSDIVPDFIESTDETCQYIGVSFSDNTNSNFTIVNWEWNFGDGSPLVSGNFPNPTHIYQNSGVFDIQLVVENIHGCTDTITKTSFITVYEVPSPRFEANILTGCAPLEVQFTEASFATAPDSVVVWNWNFGDGNILEIEETGDKLYTWTYNGSVLSVDSVAKNPIHTFELRGSYTVTLTVTDSKGCDSVLVRANYIVPTFPYPGFTVAPVTCHYTPVVFTNTSTGTDLSYQWNFGDGSPLVTDVSPLAHQYTVFQDTTITVTLRAVDVNMCDSTFSHDIIIARPYALFEADETDWDCPPFSAQFSDTSTLAIASWAWNFGDPLSGASNTAILESPQHTYTIPGLYDVQLTVTDQYGCTDVNLKTDYITLGGPTGVFTFTPTVECAPAEIDFTAVTQNAVVHIWVFDDGEALVGDETISYTYTRGRRYTPILVIRDVNDCERAIVSPDQLVIYNVDIDFDVIPPVACEERMIEFVNLSTSFFDVDNWTWEFSDGVQVNTIDATHFHAYGLHDVRLSATIETCDFSELVEDAVRVYQMPNPSFTIPNPIDRFEVVQFVNTSDTLNIPTTNVWDFGDGITATTDNPTHFYSVEGEYIVSLTQTSVPQCVRTVLFPLSVIREISLPNVFSPNGDGVNDIFMEHMEVDFIIINRWGQKLYEGRDGWDGTYNGEPVAAGTYFYIVTLPNGDIEKGPVTLLRD